MKIFCFSPFGYEGSLVTVEVDLRRGIPAVDIVGLADSAVKESRERMRSAIRNCGFDFPPERVLISLSPADLKKEGAGFDLAVALAVLYESLKEKEAFSSSIDSILIMGELELNGRVRSVKGIHAAVNTAKSAGINLCIVPEENKNEALETGGIKVFGAENLMQAFDALKNAELFTNAKKSSALEEELPEGAVNVNGIYFSAEQKEYEYYDVKNQGRLIRGLEIAATGGHNLLAFGPPGCGKTLSLQKFPALVPLLSPSQSQSVTRIYSVAGLLAPNSGTIRTRPFRMPHQTATVEGMCGGGTRCGPGEISLAHNGTLFLDEAAEFRSSVLQMLRVPLETGTITLSRAGRSTTFPAQFQLLMSTNPCPCGNFGSKEKICLCSARSIEQYWKKFSAPLLDRIDIRIQVENSGDKSGSAKSTSKLREEISKGIIFQQKRQCRQNAKLQPEEIAAYCTLTPEAQSFFNTEIEKHDFSPRAVSGCLKLGRTIADLNEKELIGKDEIQEAISLRSSNENINLISGIL